MSENWGWLVGKWFSLGEVVDVCGDTATVMDGDDEVRMLVSELLHEDYKAREGRN